MQVYMKEGFIVGLSELFTKNRNQYNILKSNSKLVGK